MGDKVYSLEQGERRLAVGLGPGFKVMIQLLKNADLRPGMSVFFG